MKEVRLFVSLIVICILWGLSLGFIVTHTDSVLVAISCGSILYLATLFSVIELHNYNSKSKQ